MSSAARSYIFMTAIAAAFLLPLLLIMIVSGGILIYVIGFYVLMSCIFGCILWSVNEARSTQPVKLLIRFQNRGTFLQKIMTYFDQNYLMCENINNNTYNVKPDLIRMPTISQWVYNWLDLARLEIILEVYDDRAIIAGTKYNQSFLKVIQAECKDS